MNIMNEMESFLSEKGAPDIEQFIDKNLQITQQIYAYLEARSWSQKDLAKALGKSEAEISKWLSGTHNLTLKSLTKLETILEQDIITTPQMARHMYEQVRFVKVNVYASVNVPVYSEEYIELNTSKPYKLQLLKAS